MCLLKAVLEVDATLLSSLPAEHNGRCSLNLAKSGTLGSQKHPFNFIPVPVPVLGKIQPDTFLFVYVYACVCMCMSV